MLTCAPVHSAPEDITLRGRPAPAFTELDQQVREYMDDNAIKAGLVGVMRDGRIIYLRGFGEDYWGDPLPENALVRIASLTKPVTAAVIRDMIAKPQYDLALESKAFNLSPGDGGILDCVNEYTPWQSLWSAPTGQGHDAITIQHLIGHAGGWADDNTDLTYREIQIYNEMTAAGEAVASPPGRRDTMRWILGKPLQFTPGSPPASQPENYSNEGYMTLGLIAEEVSGQSLISYIRQNILTPSMWVPRTEVLAGRTFRWEFVNGGIQMPQDPREPEYDHDVQVPNVFNPDGPNVSDPYGGWDHEARIGQGGLVMSAAAMLTFADHYRVGVGSIDPDISDIDTGQPLDVAPLGTSGRGHTGMLPGTRTAVGQRPDGYRVFVFVNKSSGGGHGRALRNLVYDYIDSNPVLALVMQTADGFWTFPSGGTGRNLGAYDDPYHSFAHALSTVEDGSKIRLRVGTSNYTGVITKRLLIDAPLNTASAVIGL